ncbi:MAG TPA: hypothetical protein DCM02_04485, partial [Flavobacterium sp.]|nr:hypothetical protein [Flavobacterium sp.]
MEEKENLKHQRMEKIDILIEELVNEITEQSNNYLPLIINENARVENYFSIIILGLFSKLKNEQIITQYKFQHHINGENRKHIDFFIIQGPNIILLELKHLAIDCEIKKNKRNINFYTSTADQGRKVGIVEDIIN